MYIPGRVCLDTRLLVLTCLGYLEIEEEQLIISFRARETETKARAPLENPVVFHVRYMAFFCLVDCYPNIHTASRECICLSAIYF